jgi:ketosteroid isomerase-like protein
VFAAEGWADKLAIQERINAYSDAANRADWDALEACYAPGSVWEVTEPHPIRFEEPAAIREGVVGYIGEVETFMQTVHNTVITLHGEGRASARSTLQEIVRTTGKFDVVYWGISYDELVELDGDWRFSRRRFRGVYVDRSPMGGKCTLLRGDLE